MPLTLRVTDQAGTVTLTEVPDLFEGIALAVSQPDKLAELLDENGELLMGAFVPISDDTDALHRVIAAAVGGKN